MSKPVPLSALLADPEPLARLESAAHGGSVLSGLAMLAAAPGRIAPGDWLAAAVPSMHERSELDACLVFRRTRAAGLAGPTVLDGWWSHYGPRTPPLMRHDSPDAAARLLAALSACGDVVRLRHQALDDPSAIHLAEAAKTAGLTMLVLDRHDRAALSATAPFAVAVGSALLSRRGRDLDRLWRRLEAEAETRHRTERTTTGVLDALESLAALEMTGWKRRTALAARADHIAFARDLVRTLAERGEARADVIDHAGRPIAVLITFLRAGTAMIWKVAYDESKAAASPGAQVVRLATRSFLDDPAIITVDSLAAPGHPMIERMWAGRMTIGTTIFATRPSANGKAQAVARWHDREARLRSAIKRMLRR